MTKQDLTYAEMKDIATKSWRIHVIFLCVGAIMGTGYPWVVEYSPAVNFISAMWLLLVVHHAYYAMRGQELYDLVVEVEATEKEIHSLTRRSL